MITLGRTGLTVSRMGLGLAALGRPGYINLGHAADLNHTYDVAAMEAHAQSVLDAAWAAGLRYFDAARSYGRAEVFLGSWLRARGIGPEEVTIGSKWGYTYTAGWRVEAEEHEVKEHSLDELRRQRAESDTCLGEHLDLYQIHSATLESGVLSDDAVLAELARYRDAGLAIGLSVSGVAQAETLRRALDVVVDDKPVFDTVQITWNLLEPSADAVLRDASAAGMGILVKEALANGRLTDRNTDPDFAPKLALLREIAAEHDTTLDALALAAVLAQPWADVVLSGAATVEQLQSNVTALDVTLSGDTLARLATLAEPPETYWATRSALAWN
jgi:aryl-alcohol dehydrogenase-like predicted oxidoreductase